jgi:hypothetical protein
MTLQDVMKAVDQRVSTLPIPTCWWRRLPGGYEGIIVSADADFDSLPVRREDWRVPIPG